MSAVISDCGLYRYRLERQLVPDIGRRFGASVLWVMVNPSTADATQDDATIRKVIGFSARMNCQNIFVGNLFAYRATDVRQLKTAANPVGPENDYYLDDMLAWADRVMFAWGPLAKQPKALRDRWQRVYEQTKLRGHIPFCLGTAKDGHPLHPLMQPYSADIREWTPPQTTGHTP